MAEIRIISVDFYMSPPIGGLDCMYSEFRGCSTHHVPVIRIFGTTSTGRKACFHVHGVFPYIYIPYDGKDPPDGLMYQIASNLDKAINISLGQASSITQHVYKIMLVSGIPFYGYHKREHQFFKLYFYNPLIMKKACTLLQNGTVLGKIYQPHEAHIPYILQFMIDYNLHGMSFANFLRIKYRFDSARDSDVSPDLISPPNLAKQSVCEIEADAFAQDILNRLDIAEGKLSVNPGIKALWEDEKQRRRNKDEESLISPCLTQTRVEKPPTATHVAFKSVLEERLVVVRNKESARNDHEMSVYPAETPSTQSLLNASCIENHVLSTQSSDDTLTPESKDLDVTANSTVMLDEDAQNLLELLKSLRNDVDKDSILSQVQKENDSEDEEMDLSLPLSSIQTPKKAEEFSSKATENDSDPDEFNDSYFDATIHIPQLDGSNEVDSPRGKKKRSMKEYPVGKRYNLRSKKFNTESLNESTKLEGKTTNYNANKKVIKSLVEEPRLEVRNSLVASFISESLKLPDEETKFKGSSEKNLIVISKKQSSSKLIQDCFVCVTDANQNSLLTDGETHNIKRIAQNLDLGSSKIIDCGHFAQCRNIAPDGFVNISDVSHSQEDLKAKLRKENEKQLVIDLVNAEESLKKLIQPFKSDINQELERISSKNLHPEAKNLLETPPVESVSQDENKNVKSIRAKKKRKTIKRRVRKHSKKLKMNLSALLKIKIPYNCNESTKKMFSAVKSVQKEELKKEAAGLQDANKFHNSEGNSTEQTAQENDETKEKPHSTKASEKHKLDLVVSLNNIRNSISNQASSNSNKNETMGVIDEIITQEDFNSKNNSIPQTVEVAEKKNSNHGTLHSKQNNDEPLRDTLGENKLPQNGIDEIYKKAANAEAICETNDLSLNWLQQFTKPKTHCDNLLVSSKFEDNLTSKEVKLQKINNKAIKSVFDWGNEIDQKKKIENGLSTREGVSLKKHKAKSQKIGEGEGNAASKKQKAKSQPKNKSVKSEFKQKTEIQNDLSAREDVTLKKCKAKLQKAKGKEVKASKHKKTLNCNRDKIMKNNNNCLLENGQKWSRTDLLKPKFNIVRATRPYNYVPKSKKKQTNLESTYSKILHTYPNTIWSIYQSSSEKVDESNLSVGANKASKKRDGVFVISNYQLGDGEKFDPSLFPVKNSNVTVFPAANVNENESLNPRKQEDHSKDVNIVNELSSLYDEIEMYNSGCYKQEDALVTAERNLNCTGTDSMALVASETNLNCISTDFVSFEELESDATEFDLPEDFLSETNLIKQLRISFEEDEAIQADPTLKGKDEILSFLQNSDAPEPQAYCSHEQKNEFSKELSPLINNSQDESEFKFDKKTYIESLNEKNDLLLNRQKQLWEEFSDSLRPIIEDSHISMRLILDRIRTRERKLEGRILIRNRMSKANKQVRFNDFIDELKDVEMENQKSPISACTEIKQCKLNNATEEVEFYQNKLREGEFLRNHARFNSCVASEGSICSPFNNRATNNLRFNPNQYLKTAEEGQCSSSFNFKRPLKMHNLGAPQVNECVLCEPNHRADFQYRYLDGANDGSSSEEDIDWQRTVKRKSLKSPKKFMSQNVTRQYSPLSVTFNSPSKSNKSLSNIGLQDQINEMSSLKLSKNDEKNADALKPSQKNSDDSQVKHRRLLTFTEIGITPLNNTAVEDAVLCRYTPLKSNSKKPIVNACDCESVKAKTVVKNKRKKPRDCVSVKEKTVMNNERKCNEKTNKTEEINQLVQVSSQSDAEKELLRETTQVIAPVSLDIEECNLSQNSAQYSDDLFSPEANAIDENEFASSLNQAHASEINLNRKTSEVVSSSASNELTPYQKENKHDISELTKTLTLYDEDFEISHNDDGLIVSTPKYNPPSPKAIQLSLSDYNIPEVRHEEPFYSDYSDVTGGVEVGCNVLRIPSKSAADLPEFESYTEGIEYYNRRIIENLTSQEKLSKKEFRNYKFTLFKDSDCVVTPAYPPPTRAEVEEWLKRKCEAHDETIVQKERIKIRVPQSPNANGDDSCESLSLSPCTPTEVAAKSLEPEIVKEDSPVIKKNKTLVKRKGHQQSKKGIDDSHTNSCRISGASHNNTHHFAVSLNNLQEAKVIMDHQFISVLTMEVHMQTRADFEADPQLDPIRAIFYAIHHDAPNSKTVSGAFAVDSLPQSPSKSKASISQGTGIIADLKLVDSEMNLINEFVAFIKSSDPDVLIGYEIEMHSWGYLVERGYVLGLNLVSSLSKVPGDIMLRNSEEKSASDLRLTGRIIIDFWRLMRHEIALQSYTFENIVYHVLHQRVPLYSSKELSFWWNHPTAVYRHRTLDYFLFRVVAILKIIEQLDLINRTSELARLFGIQFYEVLSRGSQFRVESMMLRLAKPLNYIAVSPNVQQRAKMRAPEWLPLIMEPESKFYAEPVVVLDFQSLYPSMIIAYNYCFSTCLGRIEHLGQNIPFEFGASQLKISRSRVRRLLKGDRLNYSPCGVAFVKSEVRQGILPRMLQEILDTRLMVKKSMKENAHDKVLQKVLHARQLGLKLIANVTYGYTAANFSGRMPAIELGDSVVSKGRETLQRAIKMVEDNHKWGARVVYGDTDSLFVLIAGKSRDNAFRIGNEIAEAVTNDNPSPVKLKLEKIFHPCILQTKKRYVGYMYESPDQKHPEFCAKGIETVRRDGCPAVSKMLEKCLKMLFDTRDVSAVRNYVVRQFSKLLTGRVSIQDLTFAKEYRGASGYRPGACVPALELAKRWTALDKRKEPRRGERVPYIIINGPPGLPLIRLVRSPRELLSNTSLRPNAIYYITKAIIPPINRCFSLIGADLNIWFNAMPRKQIQYLPSSSPSKGKKSTISQYFSSASCALCGQQTQSGLCVTCGGKIQDSTVLLHEKLRIWERNHFETSTICQSCCGRAEDLVCISLDCPVLYRRAQTEKDLQQSEFVRHLISSLPETEYD